MKYFEYPKKMVLRIQFYLPVCLFVTKSSKIFLHFCSPKWKGSCEFSPFCLCSVVHQKLQRMFLIFWKKGVVGNDGTFFLKKTMFLCLTWGKYRSKTPKLFWWLFWVSVQWWGGGYSVQASTSCQIKYSFSINLRKCCPKNQTVFISSIFNNIKKLIKFIFSSLLLDSKV